MAGESLQLIGYIFAKLTQGSTAIGAAVVRRKMRNHLARKILWKRFPTRSLPITSVPIDYWGRNRRFSS